MPCLRRLGVALLTFAIVGCTTPPTPTTDETDSGGGSGSLPDIRIDGTIFEPVAEGAVIGGGPCGDVICPIDEVMREARACT